MQNFPGVGVSPGRIIGTVRQMPKPISEPPAGEQLPAGVTAEEATAALKAAAKAVHDELKARAETVSGDGKAVLEATALMATDTMLLKVRRQTDRPRGLRAAGHLGSRRLGLGNAAQPGRLHGRARHRRPGRPGPDRGRAARRSRAGHPRLRHPVHPHRRGPRPGGHRHPGSGEDPGPCHRRRRPAVPHRHHRPLARACLPWWPPSASTSSRTAPKCTWTAPPASSPRNRTSPSGRRSALGRHRVTAVRL